MIDVNLGPNTLLQFEWLGADCLRVKRLQAAPAPTGSHRHWVAVESVHLVGERLAGLLQVVTDRPAPSGKKQ